jgi:UPF0176 protein
LSEQAQSSDLFELGVSCPTCHAHTSEDKKTKARERQRQWALAKQRSQIHIGATNPSKPLPDPSHRADL